MYELCRRVELVLLHEEGAEPSKTAPWLEARPNLARHHHIRLTHPKVRGRTCAGQHHGHIFDPCRPGPCQCAGLLLIMDFPNIVEDSATVSVYWQVQVMGPQGCCECL